MLRDDKLWSRRPLSKKLIRYAMHSVSHLIQLRAALFNDLSAMAKESDRGSVAQEIALASARAVDYCFFNSEFPSAASMAKIGTRLWAVLATRTHTGIFFKLNAGRVGLTSTPSATARFADIQPGDAVLCCVSGVSVDGTYIYLDRYDHDWDYFDHQLRPCGVPEVGAYGREHRHRTGV